MLRSVQLSLMIGPVIPLTVPRMVLDTLVEVEVTVADVGQSGFKLTFSVNKQSPLQILFLLTGGMPLLFMRVVIVATVNGVSNVLIDGVITENHISPGDKGSNSTLTIMGKDLTALMDQSNESGFLFRLAQRKPGLRCCYSSMHFLAWCPWSSRAYCFSYHCQSTRSPVSKVQIWSTFRVWPIRRVMYFTSIPDRRPARVRLIGDLRSRSARRSLP